ncbi:MAG TPA: GNAT family N-acetyltransferase [Acidimicrobiia bacterium]
MPPVEIARFRDLSAATLYEILALRAQVFVVEQACAYLDVDGRDIEPGTLHLFARAGDDGALLAYLRILEEPGNVRKIGRVVAAPAARGTGVAGDVMRVALAQCGPAEVVLDAQAPLAPWYGAFGFVAAGPEFLEDDIPHIPMRRVPRAS